ncbi:MAG: hypothetical protein FWH33_06320 [Oscillospiraceae bacterium]|nr:hypothetical protein [Oscillospiraceae bacterium]
MRYLLDTHVALWLFEGNEKLPQNARDIIFDNDNEIYVPLTSGQAPTPQSQTTLRETPGDPK